MHNTTQTFTLGDYSDGDLAILAAECTSVSHMLEVMAVKPLPGNHVTLSHRLMRLGTDTSHFVSRPPAGKRKWDPDNILVIRHGGREKAANLRDAMRARGVSYSCALCGNPGEWQGRPMRLDVDHVNGDSRNCLLENLRFLCPNCHATQPTSRRAIQGPPRRRLGYLLPSEVRAIREAYGPYEKGKRGKVPMESLARQYGVTGSAIRKIVEYRSYPELR